MTARKTTASKHRDPRDTETARHHAVENVPRVRVPLRCGELLRTLRAGKFDIVDTIYVVDSGERLLAVVDLADVLAAPEERFIEELMRTPVATVTAGTDQERVASIAVQNRLRAVPVLEKDGRFLGVVPPESLIVVLRREHVEDMHRLAGIRRERNHARGAIEAPPSRRVRDRLPWLLVGLVGSMIATWIVSRHEQALNARIEIAFFVPGIVYLADAIGTQTEAIAVRGLSLSHQPIRRLMGGELRTGLLIGASLGLLALPGVWWIFGDFDLALSVSLALLAAGGVATSIGLLLPWFLTRIGKDPAYGSGPVATIIQDVLSLLIYFAVVTLMLF
jgi:magnesium transporter